MKVQKIQSEKISSVYMYWINLWVWMTGNLILKQLFAGEVLETVLQAII